MTSELKKDSFCATTAFFFINRVFDIWNSLLHAVVAKGSVNAFKNGYELFI